MDARPDLEAARRRVRGAIARDRKTGAAFSSRFLLARIILSSQDIELLHGCPSGLFYLQSEHLPASTEIRLPDCFNRPLLSSYSSNEVPFARTRISHHDAAPAGAWLAIQECNSRYKISTFIGYEHHPTPRPSKWFRSR